MERRKKRRILTLLILVVWLVSVPVSAAGKKWIAAGTAFGLKMHTDGVIVVGIPGDAGPSYEAGIRRGDIITKINGAKITAVSEVAPLAEASNGEALTVEYKRGNADYATEVTPIPDKNETYKLGIWIRDTAAGIGTVTVIDPETHLFIGLGHGICDSESGTLVPLAFGSVEEIALSGVNMGKVGKPGEIRGSFTGRKIGKLLKNRETGIYGILTEIPDDLYEMQLEIPEKSEVKEGKAHIISTCSGKTERYEIEIEEIRRDADTRNFTVKVTDRRLLAKTGGIVQGMSGSPIIQNGKLVGAVTHVLVNDPTRGYGIFIQNMIDAA